MSQVDLAAARAATIPSPGLMPGWAGVSHFFLACYLATLLLVPDVQTAFSGLSCLAAYVAMALAARRQTRAPLAGASSRTPGPILAPALTLSVRQRWRGMAVFLVPALAWALIVALQIVTGHSPSKVSNQFVVILCVVAVGLSAVPRWQPDSRRWLLPAAALGALGAGALALWQSLVEHNLRPHGWLGATALGTGAIKFGDLATLLALLSLVLLLTARGWRRLLGVVGMAAGLLALGLSQARGGLLGALIALTMLGLALALAAWRRRAEQGDLLRAPASALASQAGAARNAAANAARNAISLTGRPPTERRGRALRLRIALAAAAVLGLTALMGLAMHERLADIEPQIERFQGGDASSEVGQRLALWQAALRAGLHAPLTGVGLGGGFAEDIQRQAAAGDIPASIEILYSQAHNQYLNGLATAGFPGLLVTLALFCLPVLALVRRIATGQDSAEARAALVISASFAGFALTDAMFDRQITIIAFFLLSSWFLNMSLARPLPERGGGPR